MDWMVNESQALWQRRRTVLKCTEEIKKRFNYEGSLYLRVAASNQRAVKAYQKAGFVYQKQIQDEVAYSNHIENFWVMRLD